jgi:protein O-GlcNAc transferase
MSDFLLQNAWRQHQAGNLNEAARLYNDVLTANPRHPGALQMLGFLHFQREEFAEAEKLMARALKIEPNSVDALYNHGCALQALDRHKEAAESFGKALALKRDHAPIHLNLGNSLFRLGRHNEALASYDRALAIQPVYPEALANRANAYLEMKRAEDALADYERALKFDPSHPVLWNNRGNALIELNRIPDAIASFEKAIALEPRYTDPIENRADALARTNRAAEALQAYTRILAKEPENAGAEHKRARLLADLKRPEEALAGFGRVLALRPGDTAAMLGQGVALSELERFHEALAVFDAVLALEPKNTDALSNRAHTLIAAKRFGEALTDCDKALVLDGAHKAALHNRASALSGLGRYPEALAAFDKTLGAGESAESWNGRGAVEVALKNIAGALRDFDKALARDPGNIPALVNRALGLSKSKRYEEAAAAAERTLALRPGHAPAMRELLHARLRCCDWRKGQDERAAIEAMLTRGERAAHPFDLLAISDSEALHLTTSRLCAAEEYPEQPALWRGERYAHEKIRIGYLSTDFRRHAVGFLIVGALEHHDRTRFEIHGFSIGSDDGSPIRKRILSTFDHFSDLRLMTDREAASLIREAEIDILVDLNAYTGDARSGIMAYRPAPVQVNYLGYPGTMGAPYIDYIVADRIVIPEIQRVHFSENVVYLPHCYQANDDKREVSDKNFTRAQFGLPEKGFVFCSLSSSYKFATPMFNVWMRLLAQVEGSVLWLLEDNEAATINLRREAEARGINASRIVFAPQLPTDEHLARQRLADLFLDTLPYNAHTTASDALWMGLPVITCKGASFSGCVAASILLAAGLPELVTESLEDYEALALKLARDPAALAAVRTKIAGLKGNCPLFDTAGFTRDLESAYEEMMARSRRGENPLSFAVPVETR